MHVATHKQRHTITNKDKYKVKSPAHSYASQVKEVLTALDRCKPEPQTAGRSGYGINKQLFYLNTLDHTPDVLLELRLASEAQLCTAYTKLERWQGLE